jgi:hypothetical protein
MSSITATVSAANPVAALQLDVELSSSGKFLIGFSIVSVLFLGQIAYNIGEFPLASDLIAYALTASYLLASGYAAVSVPSFFIYICAVAVAAFRIPFATSTTSWSSFLLLCVLYAPFSFRLVKRAEIEAILEYIIKVYVLAAAVIAAVALIQLVLVNFLKLSALTNIYFVLPQAIRGAGHYTFLREGGGLIKPNGFFLRESADLSLVTGLAFLIEYHSKRRLIYLGLLAAAVLVSLSGSGIIAIIAGFLLPRTWSRAPLFVAYFAAFVLIIYVLYSLDDPFLNLWFGRFSEFSNPNTSGYARFVAPWEMVQNSFDRDLLATWLGNGAGSFFRDLALQRFTYEVADPTWAKITYEYGLLGFVLFFALVMIRLYSSSLRVEACHFLMLSWIGFSFLLKPGYVLLIWLLTLIPKMLSAPTFKAG